MLDPRGTLAPGCLGTENDPRGSGSARRPRAWIHRCAQASAASSDARPTKGSRPWMPQRRKQPPWVGLRPTPARLDSSLYPSQRSVERCSTHEGKSPLDASTPKATPVGRAPPDARAPGFIAVPKPAQRRAMLDPRRTLAPGCLNAENNPRGSGSARRPRAWIHRCAQACAASSDARPTKGPSFLDASVLKTTPVGRAPPDARAPGFIAVPKPAQRRAVLDPRRTLAPGCLNAENNPRGSGSARRPRAWIHRCAQASAASSSA